MKKEERIAKKQREDQALNRVLWWFGGAVVLEFFLLLLNRFYLDFDYRGVNVAQNIARSLRILAWVSLAATLVFGLFWILRRKQGKKSLLLGGCTLAALALFVCALIASAWPEVGISFLYVAVPVAAVLALIYYLYQREFFLVAVQGGGALFALWAYRSRLLYDNTSVVYAIFAAVGVATLAMVVFHILLQRGSGKLGKRRVLPKRANYALLYAASGVTVAALLAALLLGTTAAYVAMIGVVAWLFGVAVYYTIRLM